MPVVALTDPILAPLLGDGEVAALFAAPGITRAMLDAEVALARAQEQVGLASAGSATTVAAAVERLLDDGPAFTRLVDTLGQSMANDGVPVTGLVRMLRDESGIATVHHGATSQDIVDTAFVLQAVQALAVLDARLAGIEEALARLVEEHADTVLAARTRTQQATPTTFGLKAANWLMPLARLHADLPRVRGNLAVVQLGGAAGTLAQVPVDKADSLVKAFAAGLGLAVPVMPWHVQRDNVTGVAAWLAQVTAVLGKFGGDVAMLATNEVGEVTLDGGGSSAMPHKNNPVAAEALGALANHSASLLPEVFNALRHGHERDGVAWAGEWLAVPPLFVTCAAATRQAAALLKSLRPDPARMRANMARMGDAVLVTGLVAALGATMPAAAARDLVMAAHAAVMADGGDLVDAVASRSPDVDLDWPALRDPLRHTGCAREMAAAALAQWRRLRQ